MTTHSTPPGTLEARVYERLQQEGLATPENGDLTALIHDEVERFQNLLRMESHEANPDAVINRAMEEIRARLGRQNPRSPRNRTGKIPARPTTAKKSHRGNDPGWFQDVTQYHDDRAKD